MGPAEAGEARDAKLELTIADGRIPDGVRCHLKLDTGVGRYGLAEVPAPPADVVGLMTHLATADDDPEFARTQLQRFRAATEQYRYLTRHAANSAATLRLPESHFDAVRCGGAIYGLSPFNSDPTDDVLEPVLSWQSFVAQVKQLQPGQSTGYGRRFVAEEPTWTGIVPVGYPDGFRRNLDGTAIRMCGRERPSIGTVMVVSYAMLPDHEIPVGL